MAGEITVTASLKCTNAAFILPQLGAAAQTINQSTIGGGSPGLVSIGTSEEVVTITDISSLGWCYMKNIDPTNYVTYGPTVSSAMAPFGRLKAGEACVFRLEPGITLRMQANTAAVKVWITVLEA